MYTKYMACLLSGLLLTSQATPCMATTNEPKATECIQQNQWKGKKVAFLGDSITDKIHVGTAGIRYQRQSVERYLETSTEVESRRWR